MLVPYEPPVGPDFAWTCCKRQCCINTDVDIVNKLRHDIWGGLDLEVGEIKDMVQRSRVGVLLQSDGKPCCVKFATKAANVSNNFMYGRKSETTGGSTSDRSRADVAILAWFESLLPIADKMPDTDWYLLSAATMKSVHEWYLEDCEQFPMIFVPCQYEWFCTVWRKFYGDMVKLRRHCKFSKCETCIQERGTKNNRKLTMEVRHAARAKLQEHYADIKVERQMSISKAFDAIREPGEFLSICQDGTNQLPFGYPNFREVDKTLGTDRLKTHLMIDIVHGRGCYVYITPEARVASDPNLTIECLQRTLASVEEHDGYLPPVLYLQLDNCFRENKNAYVVAYLTWLIERKVFKQILMSFLPVGHTHNEADQCASCLSIGCRNQDIKCLEDLHRVIQKSYFPTPIVEYVSEVLQDSTKPVSYMCVYPSGRRCEEDDEPRAAKALWAIVPREASHCYFPTPPLLLRIGRKRPGLHAN